MKTFFKLGLSMWSYVALWNRSEMDIPGFIREAKRLNVDGVELLDHFWRDRRTEMPAVAAALAETGLPVGVYSVDNDFVSADAAVRSAQVDVIMRGVDTACEFGAKTARVFSGSQKPGIQFEQALGWIVEGLSAAAEHAYACGVTLALENHGTLAGRSDQVETILKAVAHPALKANPDTGNFLLVHEPSHEAVDRLATRAAMVHFKDMLLMPDDFAGPYMRSIDRLKYAGAAIGDGDVDLADCVTSLRQAGFSGWLNIEYEAAEDPMAGVVRSVAYTRTLLDR